MRGGAGAPILFFLFLLSALCGGSALPPTFAGDAAQLLAFANDTTGYDRLSFWVDSVGHRLSGSPSLEKGLDLALQLMTDAGFSNVHGETASIPRWTRGEESLALVEPYAKKMGILGLGSSVGTDGQPLQAEVLVVEDYTQLNATAAGKIVVYNYACDWVKQPDECYSKTVTYRVDGASKAAKVGALASLCRSVTGFSLYTPHGGIQHYEKGVKQIPTAAITTEDADFLARLQSRGTRIVLSLSMEAENHNPVTSRNIIAEIPGTEHPEQVVMLGGHTDSWDVGQGAEDDGAGFMLAFEALDLIMRAGLKPKRTLRLIGWVCEEFGGVGAKQYFADHASEAGNMSMVFESDLGVFQPFGLQLSSKNPSARAIVTEIMSYAAPINASQVIDGGTAEDSDPWITAGVPGATPYNDASKYFWYHHTNADMMSHVPKEFYERSAVAVAIAAYGVSCIPDLLPRDA